MKKHYLLLKLLVLLAVLVQGVSFAQVTVDINSGNPTYPFPQFQGYNNGTETLINLGTNKPEGVTHAEMEQSIRDAYQIMANLFIYTGESYNGVQYIKGNEGCSYDCAEGDGYALLAAAYMADKTTFDGLWFRIHDEKMTGHQKYSDCSIIREGYDYGDNIIADPGSDASTDGSEDIALALYVAYMQWGEFALITDNCGNEISYKQECIDVLKGLSDTVFIAQFNSYMSGHIGFDGYVKSGNSWGELTDWSESQYPLLFVNPANLFVDFTAPAYYNEFGDLLEAEDASVYEWNVNQFRRATASSDWLMEQHYSSDLRAIPYAGVVSMASGEPVYSNYVNAEDMRWSWRNALSYVWHGNATETWNPETHQVEPGTNEFQKIMADRFASFLKNPQGEPWNNDCVASANFDNNYNGFETIPWETTLLGENPQGIYLNWLSGAAASSAVAAQDYELMASMYQQAEILWDGTEGYLESVPHYYDGWFRLLGMLTLTGNLQAPSAMVAQPNLQAYVSVDKTAANIGDQINYTLQYRNFGSADATATVLQCELPEGLDFVSATSGGSFDSSSGMVVWDIGLLDGFSSDTPEISMGEVELVVVVNNDARGILSANASITCSNGSEAVADNMPNTISAIYSKNNVDIIRNSLSVSKSVSANIVNAGDEVAYTVNFRADKAGELTGGRPGMTFSFATDDVLENESGQMFKFRVFHNAQEAYVNNSNYRYSYFYYDESISDISDWSSQFVVADGIDVAGCTVSIENYPAVLSAQGNYNQRIIVQHASEESAPTWYLDQFYELDQYIHRGEVFPIRSVINLNVATYASRNWADDWSWQLLASDGNYGLYYPISPDYTEDQAGGVVNNWMPNMCNISSQTTGRILVEEFDGYVWRKVAGDSPFTSDNVGSIAMTDTIPEGFQFVEFVGDMPMGISPTISGNVITWTCSDCTPNTDFSISYIVVANNDTDTDLDYISSVGLESDEFTSIEDTCRISVLTNYVEPLVFTVVSVTNESYTNSSDGAINISIAGGMEPYTIVWSNEAATEDLSALSTGSYTVIVTDALDSVVTETIEVGLDMVIETLTVSVESVTNESYTNSSDGAINISIAGGMEPYTIVWSNEAATEDLSALSTGSYTVIVTDALDSVVTETIEVGLDMVIETLTVSVESVTNESYTNSSDGAINISIAGGMEPYTIAWSNDAVTEDLSVLSTGTYTVIITDALDSVVTETIEVGLDMVIETLTVSVESVTNESYTNSSDGAIDISIAGGMEPYAIAWSNDAVTEDLSVLSTGSYTVVITDALDSVVTETIEVGLDMVIETLTVSVESVTNESYTNSSDGAINISIAGGMEPYSIAWSNDSATEDLSALSTGSYTVIIADALDSVVTETIEVGLDMVIETLTVSVESVTNESYTNSSDGAIDISIAGGMEPYAIAWSNDAVTEDLSVLSTGSYTVVITDALDSVVTETIEVGLDMVIETLTVSVESVTNESYTNSSDGAINISIAGGMEPYTIAWSNDAVTEDLSALSTGSYTVIITDALDSVVTETIEVGLDMVIETLTVSVESVTNESYTNSSDGAIDISIAGGMEPYTIAWSNDAVTEDLSSLSTGSYTVVITDALDSVVTETIEVGLDMVIETLTVSVESVTNESYTNSSDGAIDISIAGGMEPYTIAWSNDAVTEDLSALSTGSYTVVITDVLDSVVTETIEVGLDMVIETLTVSVESVTNESYTNSSDGAIDISIAGGMEPYTIAWSNDAVTEDLSALSTGSYTVIITDALDSVVTETIEVGLDMVIETLTVSVESVTNESYTNSSDGAIDISIAGGMEPYTIAWSNDAVTEDLSSLSTGSYTVIITDALDSVVTETIEVGLDMVIETLTVSVESVTNESYTNSSDGAINISIAGGMEPYTIAWSNDAVTEDLSSLSTGSYTVVITDALDSVVTETIEVGLDMVIETLTVSVESVTNESYTNSSDGAIDISIAGGMEPYTIAWSNDAVTEDLSALSTGSYTVIITDALDSVVTQTIEVGLDMVIEQLSGTYLVINESYSGAANGSVDIAISGGVEPYQFLWSNGQETEDIDDLSAGTYTVVVADAHGSELQLEISVDVDFIPETLEVDAVVSNETKVDENDGFIELQVQGGIEPYAYEWSNGAISANIFNLSAGEYSVTVTDVAGVSVVATIAVELDNEPLYIEGTVSSASGAITSGVVLLYVNTENSIDPYRATPIRSDGSFRFDSVVHGDYSIYAISDPELYENIYPSYYSQVIDWTAAYEINLQGNAIGVDIVLNEIIDIPSGSGSVSGMVGCSEGAYDQEFYRGMFDSDEIGMPDRVQNRVVYLLQDGEVVAWTLTDAHGEFTFNNLSNGDYDVLVESAGGAEMRSSVELTEEHNVISDLKFMIETTGGLEAADVLTVYPNPADEYLFVEMESVELVKVYNIEGCLIKTVQGSVIALTELRPGLYSVHVFSQEKKYVQTFMKR